MDKDITTKLNNEIERINKGFDDLFKIAFHDYSKDIKEIAEKKNLRKRKVK